MQILRVARAAAVRLVCAALAAFAVAGPVSAAWDKPWKSEDRALVIDAYEFNPIDWHELTADKRIAAFINKASDGLPPEWNCKGKSGDDELLCKNRWWKYSVTKELYMTRRAMAKQLGLKWGAYHLARPGNPREQADHFIDFAEPAADDLIAIDIEDNTDEWMSLEDAEIFANQIFIRTGRYPVLYTNGSTAKWISDYKETYPLLSRLPLWYARYREDITGLFPETTWPSYALWQFSSMHNCSEKACPYRVNGAQTDIDVNVSPLDVAGLKAAWPFKDLITPLEEPAAPSLVAQLGDRAAAAIATLTGGLALLAESQTIRTGPPTAEEIATAKAREPALAAYGPADGAPRSVDPLKLITETARSERRDSAARDAADAAFAPSAKMVAPATEAVRTASLGASSGLDAAMSQVAAIVPDAEAAAPVAVKSAPAFGESDRSRFRQWLKAAEITERWSALVEEPEASAVDGKAMRGPRPSASLRKAMGSAGLGAVEQRIVGAFHATR